MEDFLQYIDVIEEDEQVNRQQRLPKRYIRNVFDPFEYYRDIEFENRFRFSKEIVLDILLPLIIGNLERPTSRGLPILPVMQLLIALRFYATGNFQIVDGDLRGVSQATVSLIIKRVSTAFAEHLGNFCKFGATEQQQRHIIISFQEKFEFPSVAGCIDGTHIPIKNPGGNNAEVFRNRKRVFSLNVQVVSGPNMEILDIVVRHPGSAHDSVIFNRSSVRVRFEQGHVRGLLLGDSGYACRPYLLTPLLQPQNEQETRYNTAHKRTRNVVERLFGKWKRRFPCLSRMLRTKLETTMSVVCACAVLHNIGIEHNDINFEVDIPPEMEDIPVVQNKMLGLAFRRRFINQHF